MTEKEKKRKAAELAAKAKDLQRRMEQEIKRRNRLLSLQEASPETYRALVREKDYRDMEESMGKPVQRFRRPGETEALNRLSDFTKQYKRNQLK